MGKQSEKYIFQKHAYQRSQFVMLVGNPWEYQVRTSYNICKIPTTLRVVLVSHYQEAYITSALSII